VPHYRDVTLVNGAVLTTSKFDDNNKGGVIMFFVSGTLSICSTCRIDVSEKGWSGKWTCDVSATWAFCGRGLIYLPNSFRAQAAQIDMATVAMAQRPGTTPAKVRVLVLEAWAVSLSRIFMPLATKSQFGGMTMNIHTPGRHPFVRQWNLWSSWCRWWSRQLWDSWRVSATTFAQSSV
jgi:hypothetical protein